MAEVVVFGLGQIAEVAHYYLTYDSEHDVVAFTVDSDHIDRREFHGVPVVPFEDLETTHPAGDTALSLPLSYRDVNRFRRDRYLAARRRGYDLVSYVASNAVVANNVEIGDNCFVFEHNVIQPFVTIGNDVILWSGNHIGHHSSIGSHTFVASHVVISGNVTIGEGCFLGVNATIRDGVTISAQSVVGAGALILSDTIERGVYPGTAAQLYHKASDELRSL